MRISPAAHDDTVTHTIVHWLNTKLKQCLQITKEFRITDYNLRNGRRISPRNLDELKDEIERMQNAKAKLLEIGYKVGGGIGSRERNETSMYRLNDECGELKKDYKAKKLDVCKTLVLTHTRLPKRSGRRAKVFMGKRLVMQHQRNRIITFCVKQVGKKNLRAMQQATSSPTFCGWNRAYISERYTNEEGLFTNEFNALEEKDETHMDNPCVPMIVFRYLMILKTMNSANGQTNSP